MWILLLLLAFTSAAPPPECKPQFAPLETGSSSSASALKFWRQNEAGDWGGTGWLGWSRDSERFQPVRLLVRNLPKESLSQMFGPLTVCCAVAVVTASQGRPIARPDQLAGAWEIVRGVGVDGIFLSISTHVRGTTAQSETASQSVQIRLYHREAGKETWGWYVAAGPGARDEPAVLDGEHLRLRAVSDGPVIDVVFDPAMQRWTGTWSRGGKSQDVMLERPRAAPGALPNDLVGDWESLADSVDPWRAPTRLHIYESADGALTAWMDRFIALIDQRHGELLQASPGESHAIALETTSPGGMRYRFRGRVSADGSTLVGSWQRAEGSGGGTLNAAANFRRTR